MSTTDQNKALVYWYFDEQWNHKNDAVIDELLGAGMDPEAVRAHFEATHGPSAMSSSRSMTWWLREIKLSSNGPLTVNTGVK
jgi:hypothetical protein